MATERIPVWTTGDRMAKARDDAGVSVEEMADYVGVKRQTIGNYEHDRGKRPVPRSVLRAYSTRCNVPLAWLETGEGQDFSHSVWIEAWAA